MSDKKYGDFKMVGRLLYGVLELAPRSATIKIELQLDEWQLKPDVTKSRSDGQTLIPLIYDDPVRKMPPEMKESMKDWFKRMVDSGILFLPGVQLSRHHIDMLMELREEKGPGLMNIDDLAPQPKKPDVLVEYLPKSIPEADYNELRRQPDQIPDNLIPAVMTSKGAERYGVSPGPVMIEPLIRDQWGILTRSAWRDGEKLGGLLSVRVDSTVNANGKMVMFPPSPEPIRWWDEQIAWRLGKFDTQPYSWVVGG